MSIPREVPWSASMTFLFSKLNPVEKCKSLFNVCSKKSFLKIDVDISWSVVSTTLRQFTRFLVSKLVQTTCKKSLPEDDCLECQYCHPFSSSSCECLPLKDYFKHSFFWFSIFFGDRVLTIGSSIMILWW